MAYEQTRIIHRLHDRFNQDRKQVFFTVGTHPGAGVTYCCLNIARAAAERLTPLSVLLMDMNLHHPELSEMLGNPAKGWTSWLTEDKAFPLRQAVLEEQHGLNILPMGHTAHQTDVALQMSRDSDMFDRLKKEFDLIIADLPAFYQGSEARVFSKAADEMMIVIAAEDTRKHDAHEMVDELRSMGVAISGILFNKRKFHIPRWIYRKFF